MIDFPHMKLDTASHEQEAIKLKDDTLRQAEYAKIKDFKPGKLAILVSRVLFAVTDAIYGKAATYAKFYVIEVVARIPYQSWELWSYIVQTLFFADEQYVIKLAKQTEFSRLAQDNETMHVIVIGAILHKHRGILSDLFAFGLSFSYFLVCFTLYLISPRHAYELNVLFEEHAYNTYNGFLIAKAEELKTKSLHSVFLDWYGRHVTTEYEFIELVRNDELLHRNQTLEQISQL